MSEKELEVSASDLQLSGDKLSGIERQLTLASIWNDLSATERVPAATVLRAHFSHALRAVVAAPFTAILTLCVSVTVLLVLVCSVAALESVRGALQQEGKSLQLSLFLNDSASTEQIEELMQRVKANPVVAAQRLQSAEEALLELKQLMGSEQAVLAGLDEHNPLPRSIEITFHPQQGIESIFATFADEYKSDPNLEYVLYNRGILGQLGLALNSLRAFSFIASFILLVLASFIISSAIRLGLYAHREEIEIMRFVGATDRFIEAPYVIEGALQGVVGSLIALMGVGLIGSLARKAFGSDPILSTFVAGFEPLSALWSFGLVLGALVVAALGSLLAVRGFNLVRQ